MTDKIDCARVDGLANAHRTLSLNHRSQLTRKRRIRRSSAIDVLASR
jgi:hypothetical protein